MPKLKAGEIKTAMKKVPAWKKKGSAISRTFEFPGFLPAIKFVNSVAKLAEKADHHPDIDIRWNKVTLAYSTHSEGGLTANDFVEAAKVDQL
jgi:4a-hydroxytetrahydrobiopterin dehydratase